MRDRVEVELAFSARAPFSGAAAAPAVTESLAPSLGALASAHARARWHRLGVTLVELLIALAIFATLAAITIPIYQEHVLHLRVNEAITQMEEIETRITRFESDATRLPDTLAEAAAGKYVDPWGNPYNYLRIRGANLKGLGAQRKDKNLVPVNSDYDLYSAGPDGISKPSFTAKAARDDIVRCRNGAWIGVAEDY